MDTLAALATSLMVTRLVLCLIVTVTVTDTVIVTSIFEILALSQAEIKEWSPILRQD